MRACDAFSEEALRARKLLRDWASEGFLTEAQYVRMEQEAVCELRCTNIFLRLVLFLFTVMIVGAAAGLFSTVFLSHPAQETTGIFLLVFAALAYAGVEFAVYRGRFYRYGIEEALAACSVGFLCAGISAALFPASRSPKPHEMEFLVPAAGAIASLWIWLRFGLPYAFLASMIFVVWLPGYWTSSIWAQHLMLATVYAAGLIILAVLRSRDRFAYLNQQYSMAEVLLWLGVYLAINLQLSAVTAAEGLVGFRSTSEFPRLFYWATWVVIWGLPPAVLARGLRRKDRLVMAAGASLAVLTFVTNKPYPGWVRHSWDPMLLGAVLIGVALFIRRWLAAGPGGIRYGITAQRLSARDKRWMSAGMGAFGLVLPHSVGVNPEAGGAAVRFGGGDSGGGGASSDF